MSRARNWCFTINNWDQSDLDAIKEKATYVVCQAECGESGTPHLQGYAEFDTTMRLSAVRKLSKRAHWETRRGTQEQAIAYCKKEDTRVDGPWEFGEKKEQGKREDVLIVKEMIDEGATIADVQDAYFESWVRNYKAFDRYKRDRTESRNWEMEVLVYWGPPGTGKTRKAVEDNPGAYMKPEGEWWDGYTGQECVIMDDFYGSRMSWGFLLKLLDRYPLLVPFKGGFHQFSSKRIIITSNVDCHEWYDFVGKPQMKLQALLRRVTRKIHFDSL